jgi:multiple sugar transport system permease protein
MIVGDQYVWGSIMAGAILASLPVVLLYFLAQRFIVSGLAAGAVKG